MRKGRDRYFFPQDEKEYEKELEEETKEWEVIKLFHDAVAQGYTPDKDNKITIVDVAKDYRIEFRAITRGNPHVVVMKDNVHNIEKQYWVSNNQRHGLFLESHGGKIVKMGTYKHDKPHGRLRVWDDKKNDFVTLKYYD